MGEPVTALRLLALDDVDLEVFSAALQDAVVRIGDIRWEKGARRLTIALSRLRHEAPGPPGERVLTALQLGFVETVRARNLSPEPSAAVVQLLAVTFEPAEPPGGVVRFAFADDADLVVEVECVDAALADLGEPWPARKAPAHEV